MQKISKSFILKAPLISIVTIQILSLSSCASYRASSLDPIAAIITPCTSCTNNDITITAKAFNKEDCAKYLDRNVIRKGYQPVQMYIQNKSNQNYIFSLARINTAIAKADTVAHEVHTSTLGRVAAYGAGSLFIAPLIIPAIVDGIKSADANDRLDADYAAKSAKDTVITPYSSINTLIFIPTSQFKSELEIVLLNPQTQEPSTFNVKITQ